MGCGTKTPKDVRKLAHVESGHLPSIFTLNIDYVDVGGDPETKVRCWCTSASIAADQLPRKRTNSNSEPEWVLIEKARIGSGYSSTLSSRTYVGLSARGPSSARSHAYSESQETRDRE